MYAIQADIEVTRTNEQGEDIDHTVSIIGYFSHTDSQLDSWGYDGKPPVLFTDKEKERAVDTLYDRR